MKKILSFLFLTTFSISAMANVPFSKVICEGREHRPSAVSPRIEIFTITMHDNDTASVSRYREWITGGNHYNSSNLPGFDDGEVVNLKSSKHRNTRFSFNYSTVRGILNRAGVEVNLDIDLNSSKAILKRRFVTPIFSEPPTYGDLDELTNCEFI